MVLTQIFTIGAESLRRLRGKPLGLRVFKRSNPSGKRGSLESGHIVDWFVEIVV